VLEQIISTNDKGSYIFAPLINVHSLVEKMKKFILKVALFWLLNAFRGISKY